MASFKAFTILGIVIFSLTQCKQPTTTTTKTAVLPKMSQ